MSAHLKSLSNPCVAFCLLIAFAGPAAAQTSGTPTVITIAAGGKTGVYYAVSSAICRLINRARKSKNVVCRYKTGGSVAYIKALHKRQINVALTQADWQYHALSVVRRFGPIENFV